MRKISLSISVLGILGVGLAHSLDFKTLESSGVQMVYSARTSAISSHTVSGYGLSWSVKAVGGTADFEISHSTCSAATSVNVGSVTYVLSGENVKDQFVGIVKNPVLRIRRIDSPGCTVYVDISYLKARAPGGF